jgi:hypothetical protein
VNQDSGTHLGELGEKKNNSPLKRDGGDGVGRNSASELTEAVARSTGGAGYWPEWVYAPS